MGNIIRKVDDFFSPFIQDEAGRFFFLHLPFWGFSIFIGWHLLFEMGLFLIWAFIVFGVVPFVFAAIAQGFCEAEPSMEKRTGLRVAVGAYAAAVLALIGIPGLYFGLAFDVIRSQTFTDLYWEVIVDWWKVFHFYHELKGTQAEVKEAQAILNEYQFSYLHWQIYFLASALAVMPLMYWWLHKRARERALAEELEQSRHESEVRERLAQVEARATEMNERQSLNELRMRKEAEAEKEKQKKIQEKIREVKGKDPWDSGFL